LCIVCKGGQQVHCRAFWERAYILGAKYVTVLRSFRETALIVEAGLTGGYVLARV
jgi:hypothetical protein